MSDSKASSKKRPRTSLKPQSPVTQEQEGEEFSLGSDDVMLRVTIEVTGMENHETTQYFRRDYRHPIVEIFHPDELHKSYERFKALWDSQFSEPLLTRIQSVAQRRIKDMELEKEFETEDEEEDLALAMAVLETRGRDEDNVPEDLGKSVPGEEQIEEQENEQESDDEE